MARVTSSSRHSRKQFFLRNCESVHVAIVEGLAELSSLPHSSFLSVSIWRTFGNFASSSKSALLWAFKTPILKTSFSPTFLHLVRSFKQFSVGNRENGRGHKFVPSPSWGHASETKKGSFTQRYFFSLHFFPFSLLSFGLHWEESERSMFWKRSPARVPSFAPDFLRRRGEKNLLVSYFQLSLLSSFSAYMHSYTVMAPGSSKVTAFLKGLVGTDARSLLLNK